MAKKITNLAQIREQKELLKKEIAEKEKLLKFSNTKESLGLITQGYTNKFLENVSNDNGKQKTFIKKDVVIKEISSKIVDKIISKNTFMGIADSALKGRVLEDAIRLAAISILGKYAQKKMKSSNWKNKLIGVFLVYMAPIVLKFLHKKLESYQKNKSLSSLEKLI